MATTLNIKHLKRLHAALTRSGAVVHDTLAVGKLIADIALSHPANIRYARAIFSNIPYPPNSFMWNSMIRAYAHSSSPKEAIFLYRQMLADGFCPNNYTYPFVLKASTHFSDPRVGLGVHASIILRGFEDFDPFIQTSLMSFYAANGYVDTARCLFDSCPRRDVASWNALIKGYIQSRRYTDVVRIFRRMQDREKFEGDEITMLNVVSACAHLGALDMGRWIHAYTDKRRLRLTVNLGTALINMYARCGEIEAAYSLFQEMHDKDVRSWSVMIGGFAINGFAKKALNLFSRMQLAGISPDSVTFTAVLSACSHAGLVREGIIFLETMCEAYFVNPTIEHFGCVVDLLGRAGRLEEALDLIKRIPLQLDVALWGSLLVACRVHKNLVMGELAAKEMLKLDPCNAGALVFLSNVYASTGQWEQVEAVRDSMKERRILKPPGSSVIEVGGVIHEFLSGDKSIPQMHQVYMMLNEITRLRGLDGHNHSTEGISFNIDEEDKKHCLSQHSEKLSVAFGLINTGPGTTIRIIKNLRICDDCHSTMKFVSKAFTRLVIVRDRSRFHHFRDGACSCGDYW